MILSGNTVNLGLLFIIGSLGRLYTLLHWIYFRSLATSICTLELGGLKGYMSPSTVVSTTRRRGYRPGVLRTPAVLVVWIWMITFTIGLGAETMIQVHDAKIARNGATVYVLWDPFALCACGPKVNIVSHGLRKVDGPALLAWNSVGLVCKLLLRMRLMRNLSLLNAVFLRALILGDSPAGRSAQMRLCVKSTEIQAVISVRDAWPFS